MFDFFEDIAKKTGLPFNILNNGFRVINFCNRSVYIEGFKNIISFETSEISIKLSRGIVKVTGENLKIKEMNLEDITIVGNIFSTEIS